MGNTTALFNLEVEKPPIVGKVCSDFYLIQYEDESGGIDLVHMLCIKVEDVWYKFFFESMLAICTQGRVLPDVSGSHIRESKLNRVVSSLSGIRPRVVGCDRIALNDSIEIELKLDAGISVSMRKVEGHFKTELSLHLS